MPETTILLPVYNDDTRIATALESMVNQEEYSDYDILVIDDGSTDHTPRILADMASSYKNIRIHTHNTNRGIVASLNTGIDLCESKYIVRMDSDDESYPNRLCTQVEWMNDHFGVVASGTGMDVDNGHGLYPSIPPISPQSIRTTLLFSNALSHPTMILRADTMKENGYYYHDHKGCEDYDLWLRMSKNHELGNIEQPLLKYAAHHGGLTSEHSQDVMAWLRTHSDVYHEFFHGALTQEECLLWSAFTKNRVQRGVPGVVNAIMDIVSKIEKWCKDNEYDIDSEYFVRVCMSKVMRL